MKKTIVLLLSLVLFVGCENAANILKSPQIRAYEAEEAARQAAYQAEAQEFNKQCRLYLTASEEDAGYMQALYKGDISWDAFLQNMIQVFEKQTQGKATLKNPTKTNKPLAFLIYNDVGIRMRAMRKFLSANEKFQNEECYKSLSEQRNSLEEVRDDIYRTFYAKESSAFYKKIGFSVYDSPDYLLALLGGLTTLQPEPKTIYLISGVRVLQVLNDGILIRTFEGGVGFIKTLPNSSYVDNMMLHGAYLLPNGTKRYNDVLGSTRTVYSFKEIDMDAYYDKYTKGNFFFPEIRTMESEQEVQKFMQGLLKKK